MGDLQPIAFDIETTGFDAEAVITVAGLTTDVGSWLGLNTTGRDADSATLTADVEQSSGSDVRVDVFASERKLLAGLADMATTTIDDSRHFLTAYNGERWSGGFDLPFLRTACVRQRTPWPFPDVAYADTMDMMDGFATGDAGDLVGVYETLIGGETCDPFDDSATAVTAHESGDWTPLLLHNLADIERTHALARVAGRYIPKSDFKMKNLSPPDRTTGSIGE